MRRTDTGATLVEVRGLGQGLVVLVLVGCSRENPWFVVKGADSDTTSSTGSLPGETSSGGDSGALHTTAGDSGHESSGASTSTSTTSMATSTSTTSMSTSTSTISTSTTDPGTASSGEASGSTGSSTGDIEQETVLHDFYEKCPDMDWSDISKSYACLAMPAPPVSVSQTSILFEAKKVSGIVVYPAQGPAGFLDGAYTVALGDAVNPRFRAVLLFPAGAGVKDTIVGKVYVESVKTAQVVLDPAPIVLMSGGSAAIDLDLSGVQGEVGGLILHMLLTIDVADAMKSRGVWLHPRIVHFP